MPQALPEGREGDSRYTHLQATLQNPVDTL
jgi:hypothetical protein